MRTLVLTPPAAIVTIAAAKRHLRIDEDEADFEVADLIATATAMLDGPTGTVGRALGVQTLQLRLDGFHQRRWGTSGRHYGHAAIDLPCPPLIRVLEIAYDDETGAPRVLDPTAYRVTSESVGPALGACWPATLHAPECVRITYLAGYAGTELHPGAGVPANLRHAILLLASHYFQNRDAVVGVENRDSSTALPLGVDALVAPFRIVTP